jgi:hypothetical protein
MFALPASRCLCLLATSVTKGRTLKLPIKIVVMTINWKALEEHFLMVPYFLIFSIQPCPGKMYFLIFFLQNTKSLKS